VGVFLSLFGGRRGGRLFEAGRLLTFSAFRMGAYSRWALIRGWALIRINTVINVICLFLHSFHLSARKKTSVHIPKLFRETGKCFEESLLGFTDIKNLEIFQMNH